MKREMSPLAEGLLRLAFMRGEERVQFIKDTARDVVGATLTMSGEAVRNPRPPADDEEED